MSEGIITDRFTHFQPSRIREHEVNPPINATHASFLCRLVEASEIPRHTGQAQ
jgi:hypothetical protein